MDIKPGTVLTRTSLSGTNPTMTVRVVATVLEVVGGPMDGHVYMSKMKRGNYTPVESKNDQA
jgi:hypothetical protein